MNPMAIKAQARRVAVLGAALGALLCASCSFLPFANQAPASPLIGNWQDADHNKVTFRADAVVLTPDNGQAATMGPATCSGEYKLIYGRMETADLQKSFLSQPDLQGKLKRLLTKPEYPVADVTCDQGGTTYLMLDGNNVLAVYRDNGVGGTESLSRL